MLNKIISLIMLLAMFNFIVGCSSIQNVSVDEVSNKRISKIILSSAEQIEFEKDGVKFDKRKRLFAGNTENGRPFQTDSTQIQYIQIKESSLSGVSEQLMDYRSFAGIANEIELEPIYRATLHDGRKIRFDRSGGYVDFENEWLIGKIDDSTEAKFPLQNIGKLGVKRISFAKSILMISGVAIFALFFAIVASGKDIGSL